MIILISTKPCLYFISGIWTQVFCVYWGNAGDKTERQWYHCSLFKQMAGNGVNHIYITTECTEINHRKSGLYVIIKGVTIKLDGGGLLKLSLSVYPLSTFFRLQISVSPVDTNSCLTRVTAAKLQWGRVTHICVRNHHWFRLWLFQRQVFIWTNAGILLIRNKFQWNLNQD